MVLLRQQSCRTVFCTIFSAVFRFTWVFKLVQVGRLARHCLPPRTQDMQHTTQTPLHSLSSRSGFPTVDRCSLAPTWCTLTASLLCRKPSTPQQHSYNISCHVAINALSGVFVSRPNPGMNGRTNNAFETVCSIFEKVSIQHRAQDCKTTTAQDTTTVQLADRQPHETALTVRDSWSNQPWSPRKVLASDAWIGIYRQPVPLTVMS